MGDVLHIAPAHRHGDQNGRRRMRCFVSHRILSRLNELNARLYVKRDDATGGAELGGNKVRKLEFLLADALAGGCDSVVTVGGEQSNHCRATAAARYGFWRVFACICAIL